jgi:transposase
LLSHYTLTEYTQWHFLPQQSSCERTARRERDFKDFDKPQKLAAWAGLVPAVYQSADKFVT